MTEPERQARNASKLNEIYHVLRPKFAAVITDMEGHGFRPRIQDAWRSPAAQLQAYRSGHSELKYGRHNVTGPNNKPESFAVDLLDDDAPLNPSRPYLLKLASSAQTHGLTTGLVWGLSNWWRQKLAQAIANKEWEYDGRIGWDPCHVEFAGMALWLVKLGRRPK